MNNELNTIGARIRACRKEMGYSQETLAAKLYMKKSTISAYENNIHDIPCSVMLEIAKALYVSPEYLLAGDTEEVWIKKLVTIAREISDERLKNLLIEQTKCMVTIGKRSEPEVTSKNEP